MADWLGSGHFETDLLQLPWEAATVNADAANRRFSASLFEQIVGATVRYSPLTPKNLQQTERFTKRAKDEFLVRNESFPMSEILRLYERKLELIEQVDVAFTLVIDDWLNGSSEGMEEIFLEEGTEALISGFEGFLFDEAEAIGIAIPASGSVAIPQSVVDLARERAGDLIVGVDDTTRNTVGNIIGNALEAQDSIPQVKRTLESFLDDEDIWGARAERIARTEMNDAVSLGANRAAEDIGAKEKEWITAGGPDVDEEICLPNEGQGRIGFKRNFQSGHDFPSGHPNCRCTVVYFGSDPQKVAALLAA